MANSLSHSFLDFERLLWRVIAELARRGYYAQPADASDLIHDFFVEEWEGLTQRFESTRAPLAVYIYASFYRFARRRIVELARWTRSTVDIASIPLHDVAPSPEDELDCEVRTRDLMQALRRLPEQNRELLVSFIFDMSCNERALARASGMSRYKVHRILADTLKQVVAELGSKYPASYPQDLAALSPWFDNVEAREEAMAYGIPVRRLLDLQRREFTRLAQAVAEVSDHGVRNPMATTETQSTTPEETAFDLLKRALASSRNEEVLREVRARAAEIVKSVELADRDLTEEEQARIQRDPEWLAAVYEALAAADEEVNEREVGRDIADAINLLHEEEEREIAGAFIVLLQSIPRKLLDWETRFARVPLVSDEIQARLRTQWSIQPQAHPHANGLLKYGITPGTVFDVIEGVSLLANRLAAEQRQRVDLLFEVSEYTTVPASYVQLLAQVKASTGVPAKAAEPLLGWLGEVARYRPYLFNGFRVVDWNSEGFYLVPDTTSANQDVLRRWTEFESTESRPQRYAADNLQYG